MPYAIEGLEETLRALRKFSPDLYKQMNNEIKPELKKITLEAKSKLPFTIAGLSNFSKSPSEISKAKFPIYDDALAKRGIGFSVAPIRQKYNSAWVGRWTIFSKNPAAAIFDTAGRAHATGQPWVGSRGAAGKKYSHSNNPKAGEHFIQSMNSVAPLKQVGRGQLNRGRVIFAAVAENEGRAKKAIADAVEKAIKNFNNRSA